MESLIELRGSPVGNPFGPPGVVKPSRPATDLRFPL